MKTLVLLVFLFPFLLKAQDSGINWSNALSMADAVQKAKAENKCIFVDCFATWCRPCHAMDKDVFSNDQVAKIVNDKFIAVRVQMDKTDYDNEVVKKWYFESGRLQTNYSVTAFPTFLFFDSEGKPIHRAVGYRKPDEFISILKDALDTNKQYYSLLKNYQPGKLDTSELKGLARVLKASGGDLASRMAVEYLTKIPKSQLSNLDNINLMCDFASSKKMQEFAKKYLSSIPPQKFITETNTKLIAYFAFDSDVRNLVLKYLSGLPSTTLVLNLSLLSISGFDTDPKSKDLVMKYFNRLPYSKVFEKQNLMLLSIYTNQSKDKIFQFFYNHADKIDSSIGKDFAEGTVVNVICREEYDSIAAICKPSFANVKNDSLPWQTIKERVEKKFGKYYADRCDIQVKASLYKYLATNNNEHWNEYIEYNIQDLERYGWDTTNAFVDANFINNFVFNAIFYHSTDKQQMDTGLKLMEGVIRRNPKNANHVDTYANLLYKAGRTDDAIHWEEKAIKMATEDKDQELYLPSFNNVLSKMKQGTPTWIKEKK